ncbi:MAG: AbrB/MazE/SpoVT family DNA-binding domain-containing protein [Oscillospiraceae bacterium]|jgi:AbrB family looped-hinge helix DNA binding protein|nr:AbrB/MazE/SpoVT family DNA-binding domain-containing protein [Oscillospiraceae bacterium]
MNAQQPPEGKYMFGVVKVGEKGQIVIPKQAREVFDIKPGDMMLVFGDIKQGIALAKQEDFLKFAIDILYAKEEPEEESS